MAVYRTEFEVVGSHQFPVDMLRYDNCHPSRSEDANQIADSLRERTHSALEQKRIRLVQFSDVKGGRITDGRWSSFLWGVDRHGGYFESRKWPS